MFLRDMRDAHGYTQAQLAQRAGLDRRSISNYEKGNIPASAPRVPQGYFAVAESLSMSREEVLLLLEGARASPDGYQRIMDNIAEVHRSGAAANTTENMIAGVHYRLLGRYMAFAKGASTAGDWQLGPALTKTIGDTSLELAVQLFPNVSQFALSCVRAGADPTLRDAFEDLAHALLSQARKQNEVRDAGMIRRRTGNTHQDE